MAENNEKTTNAVDIETKSRAAYQLLREAIIDHSRASESLKDAINVLDLQFLGGNEQTGMLGFSQQIAVCTRCNKEGSAGDMVTWASVTGGSSHYLICPGCASELRDMGFKRDHDRSYTARSFNLPGVISTNLASGNPFSKLVRTWRAGRAIAKRYDQCEKSLTASLSEEERQNYDQYVSMYSCLLLGILAAGLVVIVICTLLGIKF